MRQGPISVLCSPYDPNNCLSMPDPCDSIYGSDLRVKKRRPRGPSRVCNRAARARRNWDCIGGESARSLQTQFRAREYQYQVMRILGAGGNWLALLCDADSRSEGVEKKKFLLQNTVRAYSMRQED